MIRAALDFEISYGREAHRKTQASAKEITTLNPAQPERWCTINSNS
jgi:hypothetical protein